MYKVLEESEGDLVAITVDGFTREEYEELYTYLERTYEENGSLKIYKEAEDFGFTGFLSAYTGIIPDIKYGNSFEIDKTAVVADDFWAWTLAQMWKAVGPIWPLDAGELRYFNKKEKEEALEWLKE
ncbi:MAG: STAS/SEC14 domain-containing protein [Candidatus Nanohalobium sp.]